eukprot:2070151-Pleurochrysis_carterae.AAC.1
MAMRGLVLRQNERRVTANLNVALHIGESAEAGATVSFTVQQDSRLLYKGENAHGVRLTIKAICQIDFIGTQWRFGMCKADLKKVTAFTWAPWSACPCVA